MSNPSSRKSGGKLSSPRAREVDDHAIAGRFPFVGRSVPTFAMTFVERERERVQSRTPRAEEYKNDLTRLDSVANLAHLASPLTLLLLLVAATSETTTAHECVTYVLPRSRLRVSLSRPPSRSRRSLSLIKILFSYKTSRRLSEASRDRRMRVGREGVQRSV